jgi:hypothetical protein
MSWYGINAIDKAVSRARRKRINISEDQLRSR